MSKEILYNIMPYTTKIANDFFNSTPKSPDVDKVPDSYNPPKPDAIKQREKIEKAKKEHMGKKGRIEYRNQITASKKGIENINKNMAKAD